MPNVIVPNTPVDVGLEQEILGACFQEDRSAIADVRAILSSEDFSLEQNRRILAALCVMADRGDALTWIGCAAELRARGVPLGISTLVEYSAEMAWALTKNIERAKEISNRRRLIETAYHLMNQAADPSLGFGECLDAGRAALNALVDGSSVVEIETVESIVQSLGGVTEFFAPRYGIRTPWNSVNEVTGGWNKGELAIVAARASMGKTSFALNAFYRAVKDRVPTVFYSCEMNQESIVKRLLSYLTGITFMDIQRAEMNASERRSVNEALAELCELPMRIVAAPGKTIGAIRNHAERLHRKGLCEFVLLDYIGLIRGGERSGDGNRNREMGGICRQLKLIAAELNIPVVVLAQLNRAVESRTDKHPTMADMRDSGELEEHADLIGLLFRPDYYNREDVNLRGQAEFIIAKQRNGGTPVIPLKFDYHSGGFSDPAQGEEEHHEQGDLYTGNR